LLTMKIGHGWHAFRIRLDETPLPHSTPKLSLVDLRTKTLITVAEIPTPKISARVPLNVDSLLAETDLEVTDISSLRLVEPAINTLISRYGVEEFVDCGYCYILGRPADSSGQATYTKQIAAGTLTPLSFLSALFNSSERRESKWLVLPPSDPGFVFAVKQP